MGPAEHPRIYCTERHPMHHALYPISQRRITHLGYRRPLSCYLASTISAMHKRTWDEAFGYVPQLTPSPLLLIIMSNRPPRAPPPKPLNRALATRGATPTRAGNNFVSSTNLGHTQQEIKTSLWGRIRKNEPGIIKNLIKPHLVDNNLVAAVEQAIGGNAELKAARDLLFDNLVPEKQMYTPMVSVCVGYCGELS